MPPLNGGSAALLGIPLKAGADEGSVGVLGPEGDVGLGGTRGGSASPAGQRTMQGHNNNLKKETVDSTPCRSAEHGGRAEGK